MCGGALFLAGCGATVGEQPAVEAIEQAAPALELTGRVVDSAEIFSDKFEAELSSELAQLESQTKVQLVVATTPSLHGKAIANYSIDLARNWGLGSAERDDGLLLLVAPNERRVRIEVGYGLEASVRDEEAAEILRENVLPAFENGDYEQGVRAGVNRLIDEVTPYNLKEAA